MLMDEDQLAKRLADFVGQHDTVLFSGAGVGRRAGLPDWDEYIGALATLVEPYESETADLMRKRCAEGHLGEAARLFRACPAMPRGDRISGLAAPLSTSDAEPEKLRALLALPFSAVVTTNFDRTQHDAYSQTADRAPHCAEYGEPSLREALYNWSEFYIARIHGRLEVPETMVLTDDDFERVSGDPIYCDFLRFILTRRRCLFIGFSFLDPAITAILSIYEERVGPHFPVRHLAILPKSADQKLLNRLPQLNIETLEYEDDRHHSVLWQSIRSALSRLRGADIEVGREGPEPHEMAKRILAIAFARYRLGSEIEPLKEVVVDGLVLGLLSETAITPISQLHGNLKAAIGVTPTESERVVSEAIERLKPRGWIEVAGEGVRRLMSREEDLSDALSMLANGVRERLTVRYGAELSRTAENALMKVLEGLILLRGWELGAEFSTGRGSEFFGIDNALSTLFKENRSRFYGSDPEPIRLATRDLLRQPTEAESTTLNRLARIAFGVELALDRGASLIGKQSSLPEAVYLDASVLLPAIVTGHPLQSAYSDAIQGLVNAAATGGGHCRVMVLEGFLNEVVSHKDNARRMIESSGLTDPKDLARFIDFVGAANTNVFVGGYSSFVRREGPDVKVELSFEQYLSQFAPYRSEEALASFLEREGLETVSSLEVKERTGGRRGVFFTALQEAYEAAAAPFSVSKAPILIKHEARQLAVLATDRAAGRRSFFVTADGKLRSLIRGEVLATVAESILSNTAFLQLVDLLTGLAVRNQDSLARLLWAVEAADGAGVLRGYLLDRGLREYDAGFTLKLPRLAERIASGLSSSDAEAIEKLSRVKDAGSARAALRLLDRFEESFFGGMAAEVRDLQARNRTN